MENQKTYREDLPPIPERMKKLPVERGYPVPWFVQDFDGVWDFRVVDSRKIGPAIRDKLCWICGERLGVTLAFCIGPMCAVNRAISEPPAHRECAEFSVKACPFLNQSEIKRNESRIPEKVVSSEFGLKRQPGAMGIWLTKSYRITSTDGPGVIIEMGPPDEVLWFCHGREATRQEVLDSIESGLPSLEEVAREHDGWLGLKELERRIGAVQKLLPPEQKTKHYFGSAAKRG